MKVSLLHTNSTIPFIFLIGRTSSCWDLFFNNLTAGFMFVTMITWLTAPAPFGPVMPIALTLAFFIVLLDLAPCSLPTWAIAFDSCML